MGLGTGYPRTFERLLRGYDRCDTGQPKDGARLFECEPSRSYCCCARYGADYALRSASSVLRALAKRMPSVAHRKRDSTIQDVALDDIAVGDSLVVYPHDICPVDGTLIEGNGKMNEAYLTGEPFEITKAPGSAVISGAVNGESALTITATRRKRLYSYKDVCRILHTKNSRGCGQRRDSRDSSRKTVLLQGE